MRGTYSAAVGVSILTQFAVGHTRVFSTRIAKRGITVALPGDLRLDGCSGIRVEGNSRNCLRHGDLDHLESPEAEAAYIAKVNATVDDLFSRLPLPEDPMGVALAPTQKELEETAEWDVLKESVRERYRQKVALEALEKARIDKAMLRYRSSQKAEEENLGATNTVDESEVIRKKIELMEWQIGQLEKRLKQADKNNKS